MNITFEFLKRALYLRLHICDQLRDLERRERERGGGAFVS